VGQFSVDSFPTGKVEGKVFVGFPNLTAELLAGELPNITVKQLDRFG